MAKTGNHSRNAARHGREGSKQWWLDQLHNLHASTIQRGWEPRLVQGPPLDIEGLLTPPEPFKSNLKDLRPHPADSWGYRVVARLLGEGEAAPPSKGRKQKRGGEKHDRTLLPGQPQIDLGASGLELVPMGDTTVPAKDFDDDNDPYSQLLADAGKMLGEYDYIFPKRYPARKGKDETGQSITIPARDVLVRESREPKGKGANDNLKRATVDVTPALSRAVEMMIADGKTGEARELLDELLPVLAEEYEKIFPDAKVVACGWHVMSGQLHVDFWVHSTCLEIQTIGIKSTPTLCRIWEPEGLAHQGPGPGICAWDRHMAVLGAEMDDLAPARCREVRESIKRQEARAVERGRPGVANRDIAVHRRFDEVVAGALPEEFVQRGMNAYREHLLEVYRGGDPKIAAVVADPARHARQRDRLAKALRKNHREAQAAKKAQREAEDILGGIENTRLAAKQQLEAERDEAVEAARKEAARILEAAREMEKKALVREAELPAKETAAELRGVTAAFKTVLPGEKPVAASAEGILGEITTRMETIRKETLAGLAAKTTQAEFQGVTAAFKAILPGRVPVADTAERIVDEIKNGIGAVRDAALADVLEKQDAIEIRETKIAGLEEKAGLWDQIEPLLDRVLRSLNGTAKELFDKAREGDTGKPLTSKSGWAAALVRVSKVLELAKLKSRVRKPEKDGEPRI